MRVHCAEDLQRFHQALSGFLRLKIAESVETSSYSREALGNKSEEAKEQQSSSSRVVEASGNSMNSEASSVSELLQGREDVHLYDLQCGPIFVSPEEVEKATELANEKGIGRAIKDGLEMEKGISDSKVDEPVDPSSSTRDPETSMRLPTGSPNYRAREGRSTARDVGEEVPR